MLVLDRCRALYDRLRQGGTVQPTWVSIPASGGDKPKLGAPLEKECHYFQVRVNEMFLSHARQWWVQYDPLVFAHTEFIYDKSEIAVPVVVGPAMVKESRQRVPAGMILTNTRVAGIHPYRGGRMAFTVILYRVQRQNWSRGLVDVVESAARALDFSTAVASYTKVAGAILDGVEALLGLGCTVPVAGYRVELDPQAGDDLTPRYFALVDQPAGQWDASVLRVSGGRLHDDKGPFRAADYVLYSLASTPDRDDETTLPFYPQWEQVEVEAKKATKEAYENAKRIMAALDQTLGLSPDLTRKHAEALGDEWADEMTRLHKRAVDRAERGDSEPDPMAAARQRALRILSL